MFNRTCYMFRDWALTCLDRHLMGWYPPPYIVKNNQLEFTTVMQTWLLIEWFIIIIYADLIFLPHFMTTKLALFPVSMVIRSDAILLMCVSTKLVQLNKYVKESDRMGRWWSKWLSGCKGTSMDYVRMDKLISTCIRTYLAKVVIWTLF